MSPIEQAVIEICRTVLEDATVSVDSSSATVEHWDSLGHMSIIAAIEERFSIELDVMEIAEVDNVRDLVTVVQGTIDRAERSA